MSQIDVTTVVDVETLLATLPASQNPAHPSVALGRSVHLVVDREDALFGDGSEVMVLAAVVGDQIRWQALSSTLASVYSIVMYGFQTILGGICLAKPQFNVATMPLFYPDPVSPLRFIPQEATIPYWSADIARPGFVLYGFRFAVLDGSGQTKGYYSWGGSIAIRLR